MVSWISNRLVSGGIGFDPQLVYFALKPKKGPMVRGEQLSVGTKLLGSPFGGSFFFWGGSFFFFFFLKSTVLTTKSEPGYRSEAKCLVDKQPLSKWKVSGSIPS